MHVSTYIMNIILNIPNGRKQITKINLTGDNIQQL